MNLINLLVKDVVPFAANKNLDLHFIIKLIDYRLASININTDSEIEVETYINNIRILNTLILLLGLLTEFDDKERKAYDNELLIQMLEQPSRLIKYKEYKLSVIKNRFSADIDLFEEYINLSS